MNAERRQRQYSFEGSWRDYAVYLEGRIHKLETELQEASSRLAALSNSQSRAQGSQSLPSVSDCTRLIFDNQTPESVIVPGGKQSCKRRRENESALAPVRAPVRLPARRTHTNSSLIPERDTNSNTPQPRNSKKRRKEEDKKRAEKVFEVYASGGKKGGKGEDEKHDGKEEDEKHAGKAFLSYASGDKKKWAEMREDTMFSTPDVVLRVFQLLILRPMNHIHEDFNLQRVLQKLMAQGTLPKILEGYETIHQVLLKRSNFASQLCNFGDLICYCICAVARGNGASVEYVDKLQNALLPTRNLNSVQASRIRSAAVWTASLIDALEAKLGYRASHLFVMRGPAMTGYRRWQSKGLKCSAKNDNLHQSSIETAVQDIAERFEDFEEEVPEALKISFSPASIIVSLKLWTRDQVNKALKTKLTEERYKRHCQIHEDLVSEYQHEQNQRDHFWRRREIGDSGKNCKGRSQSNGDTESPEDSSAESISHTGSLDSRQKSGSYSESSESDFDETQCSSPSDDSNRRSSSQVPRPVDNQPNEPVPQLVPHNGHSDISACARLAILAAVANDKDGYQAEEVAGHGSPSQIQSRSTSIEPSTTMPLLRGSHVVHEQIEENTPVIRPSKTAIGLGNGTRPAFVESGFVSSEKEHFSYAGLREDVFMGNEHDGPDVVDFGQFSCSGEVPR